MGRERRGRDGNVMTKIRKRDKKGDEGKRERNGMGRWKEREREKKRNIRVN